MDGTTNLAQHASFTKVKPLKKNFPVNPQKNRKSTSNQSYQEKKLLGDSIIIHNNIKIATHSFLDCLNLLPVNQINTFHFSPNSVTVTHYSHQPESPVGRTKYSSKGKEVSPWRRVLFSVCLHDYWLLINFPRKLFCVKKKDRWSRKVQIR